MRSISAVFITSTCRKKWHKTVAVGGKLDCHWEKGHLKDRESKVLFLERNTFECFIIFLPTFACIFSNFYLNLMIYFVGFLFPPWTIGYKNGTQFLWCGLRQFWYKLPLITVPNVYVHDWLFCESVLFTNITEIMLTYHWKIYHFLLCFVNNASLLWKKCI